MVCSDVVVRCGLFSAVVVAVAVNMAGVVRKPAVADCLCGILWSRRNARPGRFSRGCPGQNRRSPRAQVLVAFYRGNFATAVGIECFYSVRHCFQSLPDTSTRGCCYHGRRSVLCVVLNALVFCSASPIRMLRSWISVKAHTILSHFTFKKSMFFCFTVGKKSPSVDAVQNQWWSKGV